LLSHPKITRQESRPLLHRYVNLWGRTVQKSRGSPLPLSCHLAKQKAGQEIVLAGSGVSLFFLCAVRPAPLFSAASAAACRLLFLLYRRSFLFSFSTFLFRGAHGAALGTASATACRFLLLHGAPGAAFRASPAAASLIGGVRGSQPGASQQTGNADPCQHLLEFLGIHKRLLFLGLLCQPNGIRCRTIIPYVTVSDIPMSKQINIGKSDTKNQNIFPCDDSFLLSGKLEISDHRQMIACHP
jgi:hypothetical protein